MRVSVDLRVDEARRLDELSRARKTSRAHLIRLAVAEFLARNSAAMKDSLGLWKDRGEDGAAYQDRLRAEWQR
jgi:predicted transcriptional regulator